MCRPLTSLSILKNTVASSKQASSFPGCDPSVIQVQRELPQVLSLLAKLHKVQQHGRQKEGGGEGAPALEFENDGMS